MKALLVYRAPQFSPNSVEKDRLIIESVGSCLQQQGVETQFVDEECFNESFSGDVVLTMGRLPRTHQLLMKVQEKGCRVINSPRAMNRFSRKWVELNMRLHGIPAPQMIDVRHPADSPEGYWLKRGDEAAQHPADVVFARTREDMDRALQDFYRRGIFNLVVTRHVVGDLVKFYAVGGTGFFRYFYPTDDGYSKFGDERRNGEARHYPFDAAFLQSEVERLAELLGIAVYGGDAIVRPDGTFAIIDFNDWPSFSRCRREASEAIASLVTKRP